MRVGANCYVIGRVGMREVRILLDTGAQASIVRASQCEKFCDGADTCAAMGKVVKNTSQLRCVGIERSAGTPITQARHIKITLKEPATPGKGVHWPLTPGKQAIRDVEFLELPGATDGLVIGCEVLAEWGFGIASDDDGRMWCEFKNLGIQLPCLRRTGNLPCAVMPATTVTATGPRIVPVPVRGKRLAIEAAIE